VAVETKETLFVLSANGLIVILWLSSIVPPN
jgi:hypothetical protein